MKEEIEVERRNESGGVRKKSDVNASDSGNEQETSAVVGNKYRDASACGKDGRVSCVE